MTVTGYHIYFTSFSSIILCLIIFPRNMQKFFLLSSIWDSLISFFFIWSHLIFLVFIFEFPYLLWNFQQTQWPTLKDFQMKTKLFALGWLLIVVDQRVYIYANWFPHLKMFLRSRLLTKSCLHKKDLIFQNYFYVRLLAVAPTNNFNFRLWFE